jgi:glycerol-3-phosphate acyltransferase PlsX
MRIILDAMGGDHAPANPVRGAVLAARAYGCTVALVGPRATLEAELAQHDTSGLSLPIVDAPDVIGMDEHPAQAIRRKTASSHVVGLRMLRDGEGDAFVSAGHSGATMAGALFILGRVAGIERPALAAIFPTLHRPLLVLDVGANTDCKPEYLQQFAAMGSVYAERAMGVREPRVALLSNGEEDTKGDRLVQEAHALLRESPLRFVGNTEPKDVLVSDACDVLVADGFVGNLFLKTSEATAKFAMELSKDELKRNLWPRLLAGLAPTVLLTLLPGDGRLRALAGAIVGGGALLASLLGPPLRNVRRTTDYRSYGGAPLLGVKGVVIIAHGKSDALAMQNAIRQAKEAVESDTVSAMRPEQLQQAGR